MAQATGIRAYAAYDATIAFSTAQTGGSISHAAAFHAKAPYYVGTNTPTITNYYGLLLNDSTEYNTWVSVTTRWGVYQAGSSDNNYFNGKMLLGTTVATTDRLYVNGTTYLNGNTTVNGTFTELSTARLKTDIMTLENSLEKVDKMRAVTYKRIGGHKQEIGLIAEEVAQVYPEFVEYDNNGSPMGLHYARLTAVLLQSIKELKSELSEIKKNVN